MAIRPSQILGSFTFILGIVGLAAGYGARKAGILGMFFLFTGAYLLIDGVARLVGLSEGRRRTLNTDLTVTYHELEPPISRRIAFTILLGTIVFVGLFLWFTAQTASIWG